MISTDAGTNGPDTLTQLGQTCDRLWAVLGHPAVGVLLRRGYETAGRLHAWRELLADQMGQPPRWHLATLLRTAMVQELIPISEPEAKADGIVAMLGAHAFWRHHPHVFGAAEPEPHDSVVPRVLGIVLGPDAAAAIAAAKREAL
jgi:predicted cobalt transporter CbtA